MARIGELIDGKYEVLSLVGEGGMSYVWLTRDRRLNKLWAVKEIRREARDANNQVVIQSLITEANLMKRLDHPALPRIVDIIEDGKTIYVVMDYVEGESLNKVLKRRGRAMDEKDVIDWGIQLCDALEYLHTRRPPVIYRDMKPGNIMLRDDGTVKLIDFGIAREYKEGQSSDTQILGTRGYAAPEQFSRTVQTDARSDVYSLGVTLYALVTGRTPAEDPVLHPIRELDPSLSEGLEFIIAKATRQDPAQRYQSCAEMSYDLQNIEKLTGAYREAQLAKVRRFNLLWGLAAAFALVGAACIAASFFLKSSTYESRLASARAASTEAAENGGASAAEEFYLQAIEVDPSSVEAYSKLVNDVYKADSNFTMSEAQRLEALMEENRGSIEGSSEYAKLCYDIGNLYYVYYELPEDGGDESTYAATADASSAQWFQAAQSSYEAQGASCTLTAAENSQAVAYATIGNFRTRLTQASLEGTENEVYGEYWQALSDAYELIGSEPDAEPVVCLRLYELIYEAISSPTHLNGFRRSGVTQSDAEALLNKVLSSTEALSDQLNGEKAEEMYATIVQSSVTVTRGTGDDAHEETISTAQKNVETVFGSVGATVGDADAGADAETDDDADAAGSQGDAGQGGEAA